MSQPKPFCYSAHIGYLFSELPFERRFAAARAAGFEAVEHPAPYAWAPSEIVRLLADEGLPYIQFGLPSGDAAKGEKGIAMFPDRVAEFRESVAIGLDYAQAIGVTMVHAMAGVITASSPPRETLWSCYLDNLSFAAEKAGERGMTILVEAMSPGAVPNYLIDSPAVAAQALREVDGARQLLDIFHATSVGEDPCAVIRAEAGRIAHVHFADHPGRNEPGTGVIDFDAIRAALRETGYDGVIGCEYTPATTTGAGVGWLRDALPR